MPALADLAVVVPVGPGDAAWRALLPALAALPAEAEIVLSLVEGDAQPVDVPARVRVLRGSAGRAAQQNRGAAATSRPWLWFVHGDSRVDAGVLDAIARLPDAPALAYCDLAFHDGPWLMRLNALGAFVRSRWLGLPFGDQGLLLRRVDFDALGGFDARVGGGEDHALVWAARRARLPLVPLGVRLPTSARRYAERGWWRTTARHLRLTWAQARRFSAGRP